MNEDVKVEVLMSVMHQENFDIAYKSQIQSDLLIINQCDKDDYVEMRINGFLWRMIYTTERGLSKSRNMALKNAKGDICLLCDDDEILVENYVNIIQEVYEELSEATAVVFNIKRKNPRAKNYYQITKKKKAPWYRGYMSPMLTFRLKDIKDNKICMNEMFGSGGKWGGGEDILFEDEIRKKHMKLYENPAVIAEVDYGNGSQWFEGYNEKFFFNNGAFLWIRCKKNIFMWLVWCIYYCYKYKNERYLTSIGKVNWMKRGRRAIEQNLPYDNYIIRQKG